jgi:hypothetical protein
VVEDSVRVGQVHRLGRAVVVEVNELGRAARVRPLGCRQELARHVHPDHRRHGELAEEVRGRRALATSEVQQGGGTLTKLVEASAQPTHAAARVIALPFTRQREARLQRVTVVVRVIVER